MQPAGPQHVLSPLVCATSCIEQSAVTPAFVAVSLVRFPLASVSNVKTHASPTIVKFISTLLARLVSEDKSDVNPGSFSELRTPSGVEVVSVESGFITSCSFCIHELPASKPRLQLRGSPGGRVRGEVADNSRAIVFLNSLKRTCVLIWAGGCSLA